MFYNRLESLIKETGKTKYQLSKELGLSQSTIGNWQEGHLPTADKIIKIADYFEVSADYLLGRSNDVGIINANANLTPDETEILTLYRQMSFQDKNQLRGFAKALVY